MEALRSLTRAVVLLPPPSPSPAGQARWVPGEEGGMVFVGWENRPQKLGFVYCLNRRSVTHVSFPCFIPLTVRIRD